VKETEISLNTVVRILTRRWKWVVGMTVVVFCAVFIISHLMLKDQYTARVKILVTKSKTGEKIQPVDFTMLELDTYVHLMTSRDTLLEALKKFQLDQPPFDYDIRQFESCISVSPLRNTDLLEIQVTLPDPEKAAAVVNFLAEKAQENNFNMLIRESEQSRRMFESEVTQGKGQLEEAAQNLARFMAESETVPSEQGIRNAQEALSKMLQDKSFNVTLYKESKAKIEELSRIVDREPETRFLKRTISEDRDMLDLQREQMPEADLVDLLSLKVENENINFAYDKARTELINASKDYVGALAHYEAMQLEIDQLRQHIRKAEQELAEKKRLEEELRIAGISYQEISRKNSEAKTTIASERQELTVVEHAVKPKRPSGPNRLLLAVSGAVFAFLLTLFLSLGMDLLQSEQMKA
jgi:polysaccharide biosynthesis transport protein